MHSEMGPVRQNPIQRTVRSVHMSVQFTVYNCCTQYCTEQTGYFPSCPPYNHHCSDDVYLRKVGTLTCPAAYAGGDGSVRAHL